MYNLTLRTRNFLLRSNSFVFGFYAIIASFVCYTGMYAFRKAVSVAVFEGQEFFGIDYKILLILSQVIGYAVSKFIGIKFVSEISASKRALSIIGLVSFSGLALFFFAITPPPYSIIFLFLNGLPLGIIFGIVFNYLEGRKLTEVLVIGLIATQVFSSGLVKAVGKYLLVYGNIQETWMPVITGLIFFPLFLLSVWMLETLPIPSNEDIRLRSARSSMNASERWSLIKNFAFGLLPFIISYILLTAFRDYRDNFSADIWNALGYSNKADNFLTSELPITLVVIALLFFIKNISRNIRAFVVIHLFGIFGSLILIGSTLLFINGLLSAFWWVSLSGMGLYIIYVLANSIYFERFIATFRIRGNASFVIMLADFFGYCGSVGVLLYKNFGAGNFSHLDFYLISSLVIGMIIILLWIISCLYFYKKFKKNQNYEYRVSSL